MSYRDYFSTIRLLNRDVIKKQDEAIKQAAKLVADAIEAGGILQAFGSGHSHGTALEVCGRAGGYIPSKNISTRGIPEIVEGVGTEFMKAVDLRKEDVLIAISNSGRNPLGIEIAMEAKKRGAKVIVVTSYESSKRLTSKHSSGKKLYDMADVVLDNGAPDGDAAIEVEGLKSKAIGVSSVSGALLVQCVVLESIDMLLKRGIKPPVYMSMNIDGGPMYNEQLLSQYAHRIYRK